MTFELLVCFAVCRLIFGLFTPPIWRFLKAEFIMIPVYLVASYLLANCHWLRVVCGPAIQGILIGIVFLVTAMASRCFSNYNLLFRAPETTHDKKYPQVPIGTIDFTWLPILAVTLAIICFARSSHSIRDITPTGCGSPEFRQAELSNTVFLLGKTIDSVFLLGGILAGCMTILWAGEICARTVEKVNKNMSLLPALPDG